MLVACWLPMQGALLRAVGSSSWQRCAHPAQLCAWVVHSVSHGLGPHFQSSYLFFASCALQRLLWFEVERKVQSKSSFFSTVIGKQKKGAVLTAFCFCFFGVSGLNTRSQDVRSQ